MQHSSSQTPQQETPDLDWEVVLGLLPLGWADQARELGAFQRARKVGSPQALLRLVLMHAGVGLSFQRTAEVAEYAQLARMAKASVWERVQRVGPWLAWLISALLSQRVSAPQVAGYRPRIPDATAINGPKRTVEQRLHYCLSLASLSCDDAVISGIQQAEGFENFPVSAGDLLIGDRAYAKAKGIRAVKQAGGDVIVRLGRTSLTLYDEAGEKINWVAWLHGTPPGEPRERSAQFRDEHGDWITGRICAVALSEEHAEKARRRCRKTAQRKGSRLRDATLQAAGYLCVLTTAPRDRLPVSMVLELYRARWQVELSFKRLKSLLQADQLRESSAKSARIWLQGKMLYALLLQGCLSQAGAFSPRCGSL